MLLAASMLVTSVPMAATAAETAEDTSVEALASYDFADFDSVVSDSSNITDGERTIALVANGAGKAPALVADDARGQVLSLNEYGIGEDTSKNGYALLPENPFAGVSVEDGLTINFWTKTTGNAGGGNCLMDFEVAAVSGGENRAGTFAINQTMTYWNTTSQNGNYIDFGTSNLKLSEKKWKMVTVALTTEGVTFYSNGEKISNTVKGSTSDYNQLINDIAGTSGLANPEDTKVRLGASVAKYWNNAGALIDDISFYDKELSAYEVASIYEETLPEEEKVAIESISIAGASEVEEDRTIQLTKTVTPTNTTNKATLWESSDESVLVVDENGMVTGVKGGTAEVTATVGGMKSEPITITVIGLTDSLESGYYIAPYTTTTNFYAAAANVEQETQSVYFAVSKDGKTFEALNNNGGVVFAKSGSGRIKEPKIYRDEDKFVIVAPDASQAKMHVFTSVDGVAYYDDTLVTETEYKATALKHSAFTLMYDGENLLETDKNITLGNALAITEEEYTYIVNKLGTVVNTGLETLDTWNVEAAKDVTVDTLTAKYPSVNATYSDGSFQKFNIDWSEALANVDLTKAGTYTLTGKVNQTKYLNNLKALNGSKLPEDDPANVGNEEDNYDDVNGINYYDATKYVEGMADPCIYWDEQTQYYYMTGSYFPEAGDEIDDNDNLQQYDRVVLRRSRTLEGLQDRSKQVTIWKVGNQGFDDNGTEKNTGSRFIWAPEIHRVGDYWVVYFTESHGGGLYDIYCHALILDGDKDPYETALKASDGVSEWKDYKMCASPDDASGKIGSKDITPFKAAFCLDMTYFKDAENGEDYVIWAGKPVGNSDLFIAKVDAEKPWQLTSSCVRMTTPEYGWEKIRYQVNEGPTVLQKDGKIFMCFSNSGTGSEYSIGMMTADAGDDLLDMANWTKNPYPLLTSRDVNGEEGPGHNSFTVDQDGNPIFVYHARPTSHNYKHCGWTGTSSSYRDEPLEDPCRHARLKRVHWAADGTPILKMTYEDELLEEYATISATVVVAKDTEKPATPTPTPTPTPDTQQGGAADTGAAKEETTITLSETKISMGLKEKNVKLTATVEGPAKGQAVTWESSNTKVATVKDGKITASKNKTGKAIITATTADGKTATCEVNVKKAPKSLTLNKKSVTLKLKKNKTFQIKVKKFKPSNAASYKLTYKSSKKKVATVSKTGLVTAKKAGTTKITVKTYNGKTAKITVKVKK